jgi:hypothetical protein
MIESKRVKKNGRHSIIPTDIVNNSNFMDKNIIKRTATSIKANDNERSNSNNPKQQRANKNMNISQIGQNRHASNMVNKISEFIKNRIIMLGAMLRLKGRLR